MSVYYADHGIEIRHGQALDELAALPSAAIDCIVTSPPYYGLRDYGVDGQIGLEASPGEYIDVILRVVDELARVLRPDGTLWLNLGDVYSGKANGGPSFDRHRGHGHQAGVVAAQINTTAFAPYKSLLGLPWRIALALIDRGWTLRNDVVWHKPNAMPESVRDRLANRHEHLFLLTRGAWYEFDLDAIKVPTSGQMPGNSREDRIAYGEASGVGRDRRFGGNPRSTLLEPHADRNPGDVWSIPTARFAGAHFACMPAAVARRCILAGCKEGGVVLDPFHGAGTTARVARHLGRSYVGIELKAEYIDLSLARLGDPTLDFTEAAG